MVPTWNIPPDARPDGGADHAGPTRRVQSTRRICRGNGSLAAPDEGTRAPAAVALAAPAELLEHVLGEANPPKTKPLLRLLIDELRVNSRAEILQRRRMQRR
jgi:hypothetical protein